MGVEAGLDCLTGIDPKSIDGLFFATTTQVYTEKDSASLVATVLDLISYCFGFKRGYHYK